LEVTRLTARQWGMVQTEFEFGSSWNAGPTTGGGREIWSAGTGL
jgi:hypothetical protein